MKVETRLAENSKSAVELRDPYANYNKITVAQLKKEVPEINWDVYFTTIGLEGIWQDERGTDGRD